MCVGKNTSQPANVRNVRSRRTFHALQRAAAFSKKWLRHFFDTMKYPAIIGLQGTFISMWQIAYSALIM